MLKPDAGIISSNLVSLLEKLRQDQSNIVDWQIEKLNFIPLRGSWYANSEADFDLEEEINKFITPQNNKKIMLLMGDSGAGKSLYTQGLVNKLWQNFSAQSPIPIWLSLPSLKDPTDRAIEEIFEKYGFNKDQIEELRKTRSFIFILDAYDEIRCEKNLYQTNNLNKWNAKIIFTCRRAYLYHKDNYKLFFAPFIGDKIQYTQYEEIYIKPFNVNQIQDYIQQYIKAQATQWNNPERYVKAIEEVMGLKELIKTPFMLKLTMEALPQIVEKYTTQNMQERKKVTQAALYDVFIEQWFIRQEQKLKQSKQIKENEDIKPEFWVYAKELATEMHKSKLTQVIYNPNEESDLFSTEVKENSWAKFFTPKNPRVELLRTACLVKETNQNLYRFIHSSLLEYFLTRNLYENIVIQNMGLFTGDAQVVQKISNSQENTITAAVASLTATNGQSNTSCRDDYFNQRLIVKEDNTLQFLADRVTVQETFKKSLFDRIYSSRNNPKNKIAAANAITILNRAKIAFSGMDLSGIQIPEADLSFSLMHGTNLMEANLQSVNLRQAFLIDANLNKSNLSEIYTGQLPFLRYEYINKLLYSEKTSVLIASGNRDIILYDHLLNPMYKIKYNQEVHCLAFSADGKIIALSGRTNNSVWLWSVENRASLGCLSYQTNIKLDDTSIYCIAFDPTGKTLASGMGKNVWIWSVETKRPVGHPLEHTANISCLSFSPNGKYLVSGSRDKNVRVWDIETRQLLGSPLEYPHELKTVIFSPDNKYIACGGGDDIRNAHFHGGYNIFIWSLESLTTTPHQLKGHTNMITSLIFSPDGKLLISGSNDQTVRLWSIENKTQIDNPYIGHAEGVSSVNFIQHMNTIVSASNDKTLRFWLPNVKAPIYASNITHTDDIKEIVFNKKGNILATCSLDKTIRLWDSKLLHSLGKPLQGAKWFVNCVTFSPDSKILVSGNRMNDDFLNEGVRIWDVQSQTQIGEPNNMEHTSSDISCIAFSPNGQLLASGSYGKLVLWDMQLNSLVCQFRGNSCEIYTVHFSPDGKFLVSGSDDKTIKLYSMETYKELPVAVSGQRAKFSPAGTVLALSY